jgi:hypothetical protein
MHIECRRETRKYIEKHRQEGFRDTLTRDTKSEFPEKREVRHDILQQNLVTLDTGTLQNLVLQCHASLRILSVCRISPDSAKPNIP